MCIGAGTLGIKCKADDIWLYTPEILKNRLHIAVPVRLLGEDITSIEAQPHVLNVTNRHPVVCPHKLLLIFPEHTLKSLYVRRILLATVALLYQLNVFPYLFNQIILRFQAININHGPDNPVTEAPELACFILVGHLVEVMTHILVPLEPIP